MFVEQPISRLVPRNTQPATRLTRRYFILRNRLTKDKYGFTNPRIPNWQKSVALRHLYDRYALSTDWHVGSRCTRISWLEVKFPSDQTCCGQPGFNAGYRVEARQVADQFLHAFAHAEVIVTPSRSCAEMVRHEYPHSLPITPISWLKPGGWLHHVGI